MTTTIVHETRDYDRFKLLKGNREPNKAHCMNIEKSVTKDGCLYSPIIVNERMEIIDGQHRFEVFRRMGYPVHFIIKKGYGLREVHIYNQNTKNWSLDQFAKSYADMGLEDYKMYVYFKRKYNFGHSETMSMLAGNANSCGGKNVEAFKRGEFKINDFSRATQIAERIIQFAPYYEGFKRRSFVLAMLKIMSNPAYNHEQMISKVSYQSNKIKDQTRAQDYIDVLEKIYNFKTREEYVRFDLAA